ncbi:NitT/TauT family transport system substrate-binding protein [Actinomadura meyerae]|uniref:NitT/TauT family transport system substrate-binding protein n=1 Tax=Actinomadura meyerae TaxID=240840 RepID=A0A239KZZ7_9ACTN|nr:ABC transporter substrate-binding protein [Actinomadura meyerae]SNT22874.1 NitT/TauT family transport system substrate-binding protein [Actinomadura meyerae]
MAAAVMAGALAASVLSACGSGSASATKDASGKTVVKLGLMPISALAPLHLGMRKGIFDKHGIKLQTQVAQSGAAIVPAVVSGEQQFGFANSLTLMIARSKGVPVKIVAPAAQAGPGPSQKYEGVIVKKDSPIRAPADLAGKTVAVNALNDIGGLLISAALRKEGVDPKSIKWTEIGFPDVNAAVEAGRVDAAYQTEPFLYQATRAGSRVVLYQYPDLGDRITIASYFTSERFAKQNPKVVSDFRAAVDESYKYADAHEAEVRSIVTTFTKIPEPVARKMVLPSWSSDLDPQGNGLDLVGRVAAEDGLIKQRPDFGDLIAK